MELFRCSFSGLQQLEIEFSWFYFAALDSETKY